MSNITNNPNIILNEIAEKASVLEGKEAVRTILREIFLSGTIGTKSLARKLKMPIPTIAAIRKELEKIGLISREKKGAILTEKGLIFVNDVLGIHYLESHSCKKCESTGIVLPHEAEKLIAKQKLFSERRPKPQTEIDQAFGRPITAIRRAYLMLEKNDLEGREILLIGDDDFTSLAIAQLKTNVKITVLDIDTRLLRIIEEISKENNFHINCVTHDLRKPLAENLMNRFDVVLTDPPYTIPGLELFLSRAIHALKDEPGRKIYLAFAHRPPTIQLEVQNSLTKMGLAILQLIPGFNLYEGAEMHGNTTYISILSTTDSSQPSITSDFCEKIYTGELNPTIREYQCKNGHVIEVGFNLKIRNIEELKEKGCPECGDTEEFTRISRRKIKT